MQRGRAAEAWFLLPGDSALSEPVTDLSRALCGERVESLQKTPNSTLLSVWEELLKMCLYFLSLETCSEFLVSRPCSLRTAPPTSCRAAQRASTLQSRPQDATPTSFLMGRPLTSHSQYLSLRPPSRKRKALYLPLSNLQ